MNKIKDFFKKVTPGIKNYFKNFNLKDFMKSCYNVLKIVAKKIVGFIFQPALLNSLLAIFAGLLVGYIVMLFVAQDMWTGEWAPANAWQGLIKILTGGAQSPQYLGNVLFKAAPLILVGLSVGFAFKTGLFNIGASGQFMVGGIAALYVANLITLPGPWHFILAVLAAIIAGAIWGFVPGFLKAHFNVNEVITTIMMNYIAMYLVYMLAYSPLVYDNLLTAVNPIFPTANIPRLGLDTLFPYSNIDMSIFFFF